MGRQFIVVVYDISNDRRRVKLHNLFRDYGTPVQYSVFECYLKQDRPVKSKENVTEQGWLVQMIMLPKIHPPPFLEYQIYLQG